MTLDQIRDFALAHPAQAILGTPTGPGFEQARSNNAFRFVNQVVHDLRLRGEDEIGVLLKAGGNVAFGKYSVDNLAIRDQDLHFDIVIASESEAAAAGWGENGSFTRHGHVWSEPDPDLLLDPDNPGDPDPPSPPLPDPDPDPDPPPLPPSPPSDIEEALARIVTLLQLFAQQHQAMEQTLLEINLRQQAMDARQQTLDARQQAIQTAIAGIGGSAGFTGEARIPFLGRAPITLTPNIGER